MTECLDISNKIIQFLDEEEWKKYPTYEHALEDLIEKIVQQKTELLSKHIFELQQTNGALTDKVNELEKRFEPQAFTEVMREIEENYNNKVRLAEAKKIISEWEDSFCCGADYLYLGNKGKELRIKSQKFLNN